MFQERIIIEHERGCCLNERIDPPLVNFLSCNNSGRHCKLGHPWLYPMTLEFSRGHTLSITNNYNRWIPEQVSNVLDLSCNKPIESTQSLTHIRGLGLLQGNETEVVGISIKMWWILVGFYFYQACAYCRLNTV